MPDDHFVQLEAEMAYCGSHAAAAVKAWRRAVVAGHTLPPEVWSEVLIEVLLHEGDRHLHTAMRRNIMRADVDVVVMCAWMACAIESWQILSRATISARTKGDIT